MKEYIQIKIHPIGTEVNLTEPLVSMPGSVLDTSV